MAGFLHNLGKDARRRIVEVMLTSRSQRGLADELGVTPAAINKYMSGKTHPSDAVLERILEIANRDELIEISRIIAEDLIHSLEEYLIWAADHKALSPQLLDSMERILSRARLMAVAGRISIS